MMRSGESPYLKLLLIGLQLLCATNILAQEEKRADVGLSTLESKPFGIAFYNVDRLYDTIPSDYYDDRDFTPAARRGWDSDRYGRKIAATARVLDSMQLSIVALYGVENEAVVRDISTACSLDYLYLHRDSHRRDGLDFALFYYPDCLEIDGVVEWQNALCILGSVGKRELAIVLQHRCNSIGELLKHVAKDGTRREIIVIGEPNKENFKKFSLYEATLSASKVGRGNIYKDGRWQMRDRIYTSLRSGFRADIYIKSWLLNESGEVWSTFDNRFYYGGYSSSLPVFIYFDEMFVH